MKKITKKAEKPLKKSEVKTIKEIAKKVADDHKGDPKPQLLFKKNNEVKVEQKSQFHIWDVYGVKFILDDNNVPTRRVKCINVTSDHDTANEPELRNRLISEAEMELENMGFFMTDVDAMEHTLKELEPALDHIRHDIKYGEVCQGCASERIGVIIDFMEYLRSWRDRRLDLADDLGGTCNLPPVIPNDYQENWHIDEEKHRLVPNVKPPKEVRSFKIDNVKNLNDLAKAFEQINAPKEALDQIKDAVGKILENRATKKALPPPTKK